MCRLLLAVVLLCAFPAIAYGDAPPCAGNDYSQESAQRDATRAFTALLDDKPTVPASVRDGVATLVEIYAGISDANSDEAGDDLIVAVIPTSGRPLTTPYSERFSGSFTMRINDQSGARRFESTPKIPVLLRLADGPSVIAVSFITNKDGNSGSAESARCRAVITSAPINVVPVPPEVVATLRPVRTSDGVKLRFTTDECRTKRLDFRVTWAGRTTTFDSATPCSTRETPKRGPRGLRIEGDEDFNYATISIAQRKKFAGTVEYQMLVNRKAVKSGSFRVKGTVSRGYKGHRIYDSDFENYINVCINESYKTYADGNRLYCYVPGEPDEYSTSYSRVR